MEAAGSKEEEAVEGGREPGDCSEGSASGRASDHLIRKETQEEEKWVRIQ